MSAPSVVIVDDHHLFRAGVRAELDGLVRVLADGVLVAVELAGQGRIHPETVLP